MPIDINDIVVPAELFAADLTLEEIGGIVMVAGIIGNQISFNDITEAQMSTLTKLASKRIIKFQTVNGVTSITVDYNQAMSKLR